jgi:hypothetical protein
MKSLVDAFKALKALPVSAVILDASGVIVAVNDTWKEFGRQNGLRIPNAGVGVNYLQYCAGSEFTRELRGLLAGRLDLLTLFYPCRSVEASRGGATPAPDPAPRQSRWRHLRSRLYRS